MARADRIEKRIVVVARRLAVSLNDAQHADLDHLARHPELHSTTRWRLEHLRQFRVRMGEPAPIEELELSLAETMVEALERLLGIRPALLRRPDAPTERTPAARVA